MNPGPRDYWCREHGFFEACVTDPDRVWEQPCPRCGTVCDLRRQVPRGLTVGAAPAVNGDVPRPYYSPWVNRWIGSKRDLRQAHKELNVRPLSDRDLKDAAEESQKVVSEKRATRRWLDGIDRDPECGPPPVIEVCRGDAPE